MKKNTLSKTAFDEGSMKAFRALADSLVALGTDLRSGKYGDPINEDQVLADAQDRRIPTLFKHIVLNMTSGKIAFYETVKKSLPGADFQGLEKKLIAAANDDRAIVDLLRTRGFAVTFGRLIDAIAMSGKQIASTLEGLQIDRMVASLMAGNARRALASHLDDIAGRLEQEGLSHLAAEIDIVSNTLEKLAGAFGEISALGEDLKGAVSHDVKVSWASVPQDVKDLLRKAAETGAPLGDLLDTLDNAPDSLAKASEPKPEDK